MESFVAHSGPALGFDSISTPLHPASTSEQWSGRRIGRYFVIDVLGEGGMGVVLRAYDPRLQREVALKTLRVAGNTGATRQLVREARAMAQVNHPNVLPIYDVVDDEDGGFLSMELVEGQALSQWLAEERHSWREIIRVFVEAGRGLAAAHQHGLVHRDFKPGNVLIGSDGRIRVTDFGLVRFAMSGESSPTMRSVEVPIPGAELAPTGTVAGTPPYMSPEQHAGSNVDSRSDQYCFCVALWEALYRKRPFVEDTFDELVRAKQAGPPTPPKTRGVPRSVVAVMERGLSPDPENRLESMDRLLYILERARDRRRRAILGSGLLGASLASTFAWALPSTGACDGANEKMARVWNDESRTTLRDRFEASEAPFAAMALERLEPALDEYAQRWIDIRDGACRSTRIHKEHSDEIYEAQLACLDTRARSLESFLAVLEGGDAETLSRAVAAAGQLPSLEQCGQSDLASLVVPLPNDPDLRRQVMEARQRLELSRLLELSGRYREALEIVEETPDHDYPALRAERRLQHGSLLERIGDYPGSEQMLRAAYYEGRRLGLTEVPHQAATSLVFLAAVDLADAEAALRWAADAEVEAERHGTDDARASYLNAHGAALREAGNAEGALEYYHKARELSEEGDPRGSGTWLNEGIALVDLARLEEARDAFDQSIAITTQAYGPFHPQIAKVQLNQARLFEAMGDSEKAVATAEAGWHLLLDSLGEEHPLTIDMELELAFQLEGAGNVEAAEARVREVLRRSRNTPHTALLTFAHAARLLGTVLSRTNRRPEAISWLRSVADELRATERRSERRLYVLKVLSYELRKNGELEEAADIIIESQQLSRELFGGAHESVAYGHLELGAVREQLGQTTAARDHYDRALGGFELHDDKARIFKTHFYRGRLCHWTNDLDCARVSLNYLIQNELEQWHEMRTEATAQLALVEQEGGAFRRAVELARSVHENPDAASDARSRAYCAHALVALAEAEHETANDLARTAVELAESSPWKEHAEFVASRVAFATEGSRESIARASAASEALAKSRATGSRTIRTRIDAWLSTVDARH